MAKRIFLFHSQNGIYSPNPSKLKKGDDNINMKQKETNYISFTNTGKDLRIGLGIFEFERYKIHKI